MATSNRRVAAYLPSEIDEAFIAFKIQHGLASEDEPNQNDSQGLIQILSEFLGVSQKVAHSSTAGIINRLELLEKEVAYFHETLDQHSKSLKAEINESTIKIKSELLNELNSRLPKEKVVHLEQLGLLAQSAPGSEDISNTSSDLESDSLKPQSADLGPMNGPELSKRFGLTGNSVTKMKYQYRENPEKFENWSRSKDPDGLAWEFRDKKYWAKK